MAELVNGTVQPPPNLLERLAAALHESLDQDARIARQDENGHRARLEQPDLRRPIDFNVQQDMSS